MSLFFGKDKYETGSMFKGSSIEHFPKPMKVAEHGKDDHVRYVIKTEEGYVEKIHITYADDSPIEIDADYVKDIRKAQRYIEAEVAHRNAKCVGGTVVIILIKEAIEVISGE